MKKNQKEKKYDASQLEERVLVQLKSEVSNQIQATLDAFRLFGEKDAKQYPETLHKMGIFQDRIFTTYLSHLYETSQFLGPEMVENNNEKQHTALCLKAPMWMRFESYNHLLSTAALVAMYSTPLKKEEMNRLKSLVNDPVVYAFLLQFVDGAINSVLGRS